MLLADLVMSNTRMPSNGLGGSDVLNLRIATVFSPCTKICRNRRKIMLIGLESGVNISRARVYDMLLALCNVKTITIFKKSWRHILKESLASLQCSRPREIFTTDARTYFSDGNEAKPVAGNHWLRMSPSVALLRGQVWSSLGIRCQQQQLVD